MARQFPEDGPKIIWRVPVNLGYGGPAVADGKVYLMDYVRESGEIINNPGRAIPLKGKERTLCFELKTGKQLWAAEAEVDYNLSYPAGPRCTPTVADGKVYALGAMGHLTCYDATTGEKIWSHNLPEKYGAEIPIWGYSSQPLVDDGKVFTLAGGEGSVAIALDAKTGDEVWTALSAPEPGYAPPAMMTTAGTKQLLIFTPTHLNSLDPKDGRVFWKVSIKPDYNMSIMAPQVSKDRVYVSGIGSKAVLVDVNDRPGGGAPTASALWRPLPKHGVYCANSTPVIVEDTIYGNDIRTNSLMAVDMKDGKRLWETRKPTVGEDAQGRLNHGTVFLAYHPGNELFYLFNEQGDLIIAKLDREGYEEVGRAHIVEPTNEAFGREVVWSAPAFAAKSAFVRNDKELVRVDLSE